MKTVIVGDSVKKRHMVLLIVAGAALLVLAIAGGIALRMKLSDNNNQTKQTTTVTLPASASKAQALSTSGNNAAAHKQLDDALSQPGLSASDKYAMYYQQGTTYFNEANYPQAIASYKQAEASQATQSLSESIGDAYAVQGDKDQAIVAYKKAIQLTPTSDNPVGGDEKSALEQKIRNLGGQP
ncbi:MAG TPA: tetratricopeptide repeat protein [Candidatus Saccharimonadales bacterium]|jgi:tetratricopeptide (TPR) repeat protein|nr:tetratricopeptide repeat protein [Candidatus Saccharimonadales bacterium]